MKVDWSDNQYLKWDPKWSFEWYPKWNGSCRKKAFKVVDNVKACESACFCETIIC